MAVDAKFATKIGLVVATVGSAIGLGNVWRFPSLVQSNGGAAFLVVYLLCVFILGIPVMLAEFAVGRSGQSDAVNNFRVLTPGKKWWITGAIGLIASYLILSYYLVVAGWTLDYVYISLTGSLFDGFEQASAAGSEQFFVDRMNVLMNSPVEPVIWTFVALILNFAVLIFGVQKGIEKISNVVMPFLFVALVIFAVRALTLPNAMAGVDFFLKPDFSKLSIDVVISALGQAFFSLSLGMGILLTYSAYYPKETRLTRTATQVSLLDFGAAFLMGLIIFPAVCSFNMNSASVQGTTLVFVTMPEIFANMGATQFWSVLFFVLLAIAALTSTISLGEVAVAFVAQYLKVSRAKSCFIVMLPLAVLSPICSLSLGAMPELKIAGMAVFDFLDTFATNFMLPVSAFLTCVYVAWVLPKDYIKNELTNNGTNRTRTLPATMFSIRYVSPILIASILIAKLIDML